MPRRRCIRSPARASISVCATRPAWRRCSRTDARSRRRVRSGDGLWLERYREWREADRTNIVRFTDGLVRCSASRSADQGAARRRHARVRSHAGGEGRAVAALAGGGRADPETGAWREPALMRPDFHIIIVGGGMVGACAAALAAPIRTSLSCASQSWKRIRRRHRAGRCRSARVGRVACLAAHSRGVGAWPLVPAQSLSPYEEMIVWDAAGKPRGAGAIHFSAARRASRTSGTSSRTAGCSGRCTSLAVPPGSRCCAPSWQV